MLLTVNMNYVFLLLGSNLGDRKRNFQRAKEFINRQCGTITRSSSLYETEAWGKTGQPAYLNQALEIETEMSAEQLMKEILSIEKIMGRERKEKYDPRIIDIDILLFNREQYEGPLLKIPHPEIQNRRFALTPLAEIAPAVQHPVLNKSISRLLKECSDKLAVKKYH